MAKRRHSLQVSSASMRMPGRLFIHTKASVTSIIVWMSVLVVAASGQEPGTEVKSGNIAADSSGPATSSPISGTTWTSIGPAPLSVSSAAGNPNSNVSGRIAGVAADPNDPNTIYIAAAGGGVWKTTNAVTAGSGLTWTPLTDSQASLSMGAIAISPSNPLVIYAGTGEANNSGDSNYGRGILISVDGGASWVLRQGPGSIFNRMATGAIAVHPTDPNTAYAAMHAGIENGVTGIPGIYKTTDGGVTWTNTTSGISTTQSYSDVQIDMTTPSTLYMAIGPSFNATVNGVYRSTNSGTSWTKLTNAPDGATNSNVGRISLAVSKSNSLVIYVTTENVSTSGVLSVVRSDNGGFTFTTVTPPNYMGSQGWYDQAVIVDPSNSAVVYVTGAAGANSMLQSVNGGASWTDIHTGGAPANTSPHVDHHGLAFDASGLLLDVNDGGIYRLTDPTVPSWLDINGNLATIQFQGIGLHPSDPNRAIAGSQDNGTELYTGNPIWRETDGGDGGFARFSQTNGNVVYHISPVASFGSTGFFRRSSDGGNTWVSRTTGFVNTNTFNFYAPFVVDPGDGNRLLTGGDRVYESTNAADLWSAISSPGTGGWTVSNSISAIGLAPSDPSTVYAATSGNHIFATVNHGSTWVDHPIGVGGTVADIEVDPDVSATAYAVISNFTGAGNVFKTTTGGSSWTNISGNLPGEPVWSLQIDPNGTLYVGADDGVYFTTNGGGSWSRFGLAFPNAQVYQIALNSSLQILAAATHGRGAWEISTNTLVPDLALAKTHVGNFTQGQIGATFSITVSNTGNASTTGTVTLTETVPSGLMATSMVGAGWTCTQPAGPCSRSDALTSSGTYPAITVTVNVAGDAPALVTNTASVSGGGETNTANDTANDHTNIVPPVDADLTIAKTHSGNFTPGQIGASYSIVVGNAGGIPTSGAVSVADTLPAGLTATSIRGTGWGCTQPGGPCSRSDALASSGTYPAITITVNVAGDAPALVTNTATVSGGDETDISNDTASDRTLIQSPLQFIPVTPCRVMDTRGPAGTLGAPFIAGGSTRLVPVLASACGIPANAAAYSLNVTVVPRTGTLGFISIWPAGQPQPLVSTLNSPDGSILANAAIVPSGTDGAIDVFASNDTEMIIDTNGYFLPAAEGGLQFYPVTPCRVLDTRSPADTFGGPTIAGDTSRSFPIRSSSCGIPATSAAYSFNVTVVPHGPLGFLTAWPTGQSQPFVSTLNSLDGTILANAAIVPAGTGGAVSFFATDTTDLVVDINGYFAPPGEGGLNFFTQTPCRLVDTRNPAGPLGGPIVGGGTSRTFPLLSSACGVPATVAAYSLNMTIVPSGPLGFLTTWPTGQVQPFVSTLNAPKGLTVANAAIVPSGAGGSEDAFVTDETDLIIDIGGYFAP